MPGVVPFCQDRNDNGSPQKANSREVLFLELSKEQMKFFISTEERNPHMPRKEKQPIAHAHVTKDQKMRKRCEL